jgi:PAS domain S-box-containing protein
MPFAEDSNLAGADAVFDVTEPIEEAGELFGSVERGLSAEHIRSVLGNARNRMMTIAAVEMALVALFSFVLGTYLTRQLSRLRDASQRVADGGPGYQIDVVGSDELAATSRAFNVMSERLKTYYDRLKDTHAAVIASVSDGVVSLDQDGTIRAINGAASSIFGVAPQVALGRPVGDLIPAPFDPASWSAQHTEFLARHGSGRLIELEVSVSLLDVVSGGGALLCIIRDVSARKKAERKIARYAALLEEQNRELRDFAYVASHDLQEPLRKVRTFADMFIEDHGASVPADGKHLLDRMSQSAARMQTLINELLAYSRINTRFEPAAGVELSTVLESVLADLELAIQESGAEISADPLPELPGDPTQLRQLFQNLVSNSLKFRRPGVAPMIRITHAVLEPGAAEDAPDNAVRYHRISVSDNGIGFDQKYATRVFEVFERLNAKKDYPGTGIGLAICQKIVRRHGGCIEAQSEPERGATFEVLLPEAPHMDTEISSELD